MPSGKEEVTGAPEGTLALMVTVEPLLKTFPGRKFILVGDTGEQDPEIFGELARKHPHIEHVYLRDTTREPADGERLNRAFADVPAKRWEVWR